MGERRTARELALDSGLRGALIRGRTDSSMIYRVTDIDVSTKTLPEGILRVETHTLSRVSYLKEKGIPIPAGQETQNMAYEKRDHERILLSTVLSNPRYIEATQAELDTIKQGKRLDLSAETS